MSELDNQHRELLAEPWPRGERGKGLVLADGALRTWRVLPGGDPHHTPAMDLLGIPEGKVVAYLGIEPDGEVEVWSTGRGTDQLVDQALASDKRLYPADNVLDFLTFDEGSPAAERDPPEAP